MSPRRAANDPEIRHRLTGRQQEVLALMARGKTNGEIAKALGISLNGAKWHVSEVLARMGVETREEAVAQWKATRNTTARLKRSLTSPWWIPIGAALAATVVLVALGIVLMPRDSAYVEREAGQPELMPVASSDTWAVAWDERGGLPGMASRVLALRWDSERTWVVLLDSTTGRIAVRWDVGYRPMALLDAENNEVLISHQPVLVAGELAPQHQLLRFRLDDLRNPEIIEIDGRINPIIGTAGMMFSLDNDWLYYAASSPYPECLADGVGTDCAGGWVGIVSLRSQLRSNGLHPLPGEGCYEILPSAPTADAVTIICRNNTNYPPGLTEAFAISPNGTASKVALPYEASFGPAVHQMVDGSVVEAWSLSRYEADGGFTLQWRQEPGGSELSEPWSIPGLADFTPVGGESPVLLGMMRDGRLVSLDLSRSEVVELPNTLPPAPFDDWTFAP